MSISLKEINQLSWRDFKALCKENEVKLNGKRPEVTEKLAEKLGIAIEEKKPKVDGLKVLESVSYGLKNIYEQKLYPLEEYYRFHEFCSPALDNPDFTAKPMTVKVCLLNWTLRMHSVRIKRVNLRSKLLVMNGPEHCVHQNRIMQDHLESSQPRRRSELQKMLMIFEEII